MRLSRLQSTLLAASQVLSALDSLGPTPWVALAAACFACVGLQVGPSLAARRPATAAHDAEAAGGEDEDQWAVVTDAGQLGPSIRATDDTAASSTGGVTGRNENGAGYLLHSSGPEESMGFILASRQRWAGATSIAGSQGWRFAGTLSGGTRFAMPWRTPLGLTPSF